MAESGKAQKTKAAKKADKQPKKSWFKGLKSEFSKIVWTDKVTLGKQTVAVVSVSVVVGAIIAVLDNVVLRFMNLIIG